MELERAIDSRRALWTLVWFAVMSVGINSWSSWSQWPGFAIVAPLVTLVGAIGVSLVWLVPPHWTSRLEHAAVGVAMSSVVVTYAPSMLVERFFNTDAAAFNQRATWLLARGRDPYAAVFHGSSLALDHAASYWTYLLNGGHVDQVSYPAGAFVLQWPLQVLGVTRLGTNWLDLAAWLAASLLLYVWSPAAAKWLAPLLLLTSVFTFSFAHGGTDALFVPFMIIAAYRWDDFVVAHAPRWTRWLSPVALGVACSIKQTPWFSLPFFVLGIAMESSLLGRRPLRDAARYVGWVALPFLVINLPFIVWSPSAWLRGTTLPMSEPLIPDGQGLVTLVTHGVATVLHPQRLQLAAVLVLVIMLWAYQRWYAALKPVWLFALPLVLFVPSRSLSSYLVDFVPAAFVAALSTRRVVVPRRRVPWSMGVAAFAALALMVSSFLGSPLGVRLDHVSATRVGLRFTTMSLTLVNHTNGVVHPHVLVQVGSSHPVGFWTFVGHPGGVALGAKATKTYELLAPAAMYTPARHESWLVEVTSASPSFVVTSGTLTWHRGPTHPLSSP